MNRPMLYNMEPPLLYDSKPSKIQSDINPSKLCDVEDKANYTEIREYFESSFDAPPDFFVRVPGRVNLIGEHIDYCGYFVLPMAIEQDIIMAVRINDSDTINLVNFNSKKYKDFSFDVDDLSVDGSYPKWYDYFICGYRGMVRNYRLTNKGLDVVVKGSIPPSAGLSSSSALVCASALAVCHANRLDLTRMILASLCAEAENYIGTQGGGMDQAIGFLADPGAAKFIEFNPLRGTNVPLPESVAFVVCNSFVPMNKAATNHFNTRVLECKLAAKVLAKMHGFNWRRVEKLSQIPSLLQKDISEMKDIVREDLSFNVYNIYELCEILEIPDTELTSMLSQNIKHLESFNLMERSTHVFEEAIRVREFKRICEDKNVDVKKLGQLMNESHASCRDLYDCSHRFLNELVETAISAGALGSRLTGAGWGGCCVSMVWKTNVQEFMSIMKEKYYEKRVNDTVYKIDINSAMFATKPSCGAEVFI